MMTSAAERTIPMWPDHMTTRDDVADLKNKFHGPKKPRWKRIDGRWELVGTGIYIDGDYTVYRLSGVISGGHKTLIDAAMVAEAAR